MSIDSIIAQADDEGGPVPLARLRENLIDLDLAIADTGIDEDDGARLADLHALRRQHLDALARCELREVTP